MEHLLNLRASIQVREASVILYMLII